MHWYVTFRSVKGFWRYDHPIARWSWHCFAPGRVTPTTNWQFSIKHLFRNVVSSVNTGRSLCRLEMDERTQATDYINTKAKCRHLNKLTWNGTLRQMFIRVYILEIQLVMLVFSTQLCELLPLSPSLWFNSPPFPVWISILYTHIQYARGRGGMGFWALHR